MNDFYREGLEAVELQQLVVNVVESGVESLTDILSEVSRRAPQCDWPSLNAIVTTLIADGRLVATEVVAIKRNTK
ncbi:hypothetical protein [Rhodococcus opacus]|uniref:hypothetical protein n=1 Tax=Rhodococcus opacus TaxID=37919 RepID=UPI00155A37AB|nr:hypothetical protein [Rhodococcus opacus]